jgi:death-on-curing protein
VRYLSYVDAVRAIDRARQQAARQGDPGRAPPQRLTDCNEHLVQSGLTAPQAGFNGIEVYPDLYTKAAVLALAFARHQRCPNGNKRTAFILLIAFLAINGYLLEADEDEAANVFLAVTVDPSDELARASLSSWIEIHAVEIETPA